jgi:hypothetical protein
MTWTNFELSPSDGRRLKPRPLLSLLARLALWVYRCRGQRTGPSIIMIGFRFSALFISVLLVMRLCGPACRALSDYDQRQSVDPGTEVLPAS